MREIVTEDLANRALHAHQQEEKLHLLVNVPPEIIIQIFGHLIEAIDQICLSLASSSLHSLLSPFTPYFPLTYGSPSSSHPLPKPAGCRHCIPVLYFPAHCELHYHIQSWFPSDHTYCSNCERFTMYEGKGFSDSKEHCGICGVGYRRVYERGRRILSPKRKGGAVEQEAGRKAFRGSRWFNKVD